MGTHASYRQIDIFFGLFSHLDWSFEAKQRVWEVSRVEIWGGDTIWDTEEVNAMKERKFNYFNSFYLMNATWMLPQSIVHPRPQSVFTFHHPWAIGKYCFWSDVSKLKISFDVSSHLIRDFTMRMLHIKCPRENKFRSGKIATKVTNAHNLYLFVFLTLGYLTPFVINLSSLWPFFLLLLLLFNF